MPAYHFHRVDRFGAHHVGPTIVCDSDAAACHAARDYTGIQGTDIAEVWRETILVAVVLPAK